MAGGWGLYLAHPRFYAVLTNIISDRDLLTNEHADGIYVIDKTAMSCCMSTNQNSLMCMVKCVGETCYAVVHGLDSPAYFVR